MHEEWSRFQANYETDTDKYLHSHFRIESDVLLGRNCDLKTLLVGTGIDNMGRTQSCCDFTN